MYHAFPSYPNNVKKATIIFEQIYILKLISNFENPKGV